MRPRDTGSVTVPYRNTARRSGPLRASGLALQRTGRFAFACSLALLVGGCGFGRVLADLKIYWMCKQDGGVKVFEKDAPPKELLLPDGKFDSRRIANSTSADSYYAIESHQTLQTGEPSVHRTETRVVRRRDRALLGSAISYYRPTDSLGAFSLFPTHYRCPEEAGLHSLIESVFGVEAAWR